MLKLISAFNSSEENHNFTENQEGRFLTWFTNKPDANFHNPFCLKIQSLITLKRTFYNQNGYFFTQIRNIKFHRCTYFWTVHVCKGTKCLKKKIDRNYTGGSTLKNSNCIATYFPSQTIQVRWAKHSCTLIWTPTYGHTIVGWRTKTYISQFCTDTRYRLEDLPGVTANRDC